MISVIVKKRINILFKRSR